MDKKNVFANFTNQYSLSKTLRFELKPVGEEVEYIDSITGEIRKMTTTEKMLIESGVFKKDELIQKKYEATKPFFDILHRDFVDESLDKAVLSGINGYLDIFRKWKNDKKANEKELQKKETELRKEVVTFFDGQAVKWAEEYPGLKNKNTGILCEENVFEYLLKVRYGKKEKSFLKDEKGNFLLDDEGNRISIFDSWKGFTGYFGKYFETRKNFYKDDGISTALATRIIDQNLRRFCDNILNFERVKNEVDFSEVERTFGKSLSEVFSLEFYNTCLLQKGIDFYNRVLGGETLENGEKKKGLNELINLNKQKNGKKLPFFKLLDKQILSEKEKFVDEIEDEKHLLEVLKKFYESAENKINGFKILWENFLHNQTEYDLKEIYISKEAFNTIEYRWTDEQEVFEANLFDVLKADKLVSGSATKKKDTGYSFPDFISFGHIKVALEKVAAKKFWKERYYNEISEFGEKKIWEQFLAIFNFEFCLLFDREIINSKTGLKERIGYNYFKSQFEKLLENFENNPKSKVVVKNFADEVLRIYQMAKYFALEKKRKWVGDEYNPGNFYQNPGFGYKNKFYDNAYEEIVQVYNKLRNYLTKKPYSEVKWKLNFDNPTLADGWDKNKETDNWAVILRKDDKYFLGLMAKGHNKIFDNKFLDEFSDGIEKGKYEKMVYKFFPDQAKMFPKVCFSKKGLEFFQPSEEIYRIYKNSEFKKGETFSVESMRKLIDFYKDCLTRYEGWKCYDFKHLKPILDYRENIGEFFRDVAEDGYKISFQDISERYIDEKNKNGELFLFQIKNKDWNEGTKGKKNLHTLYFDSLFSPENISNNFPFKLNGQAEIFYRPKTGKEKLGVKKDSQGKEVINHKRYCKNKIFFHVPLTLNRIKPDMNQWRFNSEINSFLANNPSINIIGVDRGEKHLAYYSVIDQQSKILESGSLNEISGVNYAQKLEEKAKSREQARKDWQDVEGIKDLKKGYISQVVRKLADLAIEYNAIVVFEDLNMRFKQIRGGIEKSVYQQLEKALIDKLNFLVNKGETDPEKAGHLLRAYQLAAPFTTFKDMGKQTGIIFYTQAGYTSKIDPVTGWRPNLYLKYSSAEKAKADILKFSKIEFIQGRLEFTYNLKDFLAEKQKPRFSQKTEWVVCSNVERWRWNKSLNNNKGGHDHYDNLTENFKQLFVDFGIKINDDILGQIETIETKGNEKFFKDFIFFFGLICQIRNTDDNATDINKQDFILSPVEPFFDSRRASDFGESLPKNGDENGAFNIARKGIIILKRISDFGSLSEEERKKLKYPDLFISNQEWDDFICS